MQETIVRVNSCHFPENISDEKSSQTVDTELKKDIYDNIIYDDTKKRIRVSLSNIEKWKKANIYLTTSKYIFLVLVPILSLLSPQDFIKNKGLSEYFAYSSGALSSLVIGMERTIKFCESVKDEKISELNIMLKQLGIKMEYKDVSDMNNSDTSSPKK